MTVHSLMSGCDEEEAVRTNEPVEHVGMDANDLLQGVQKVASIGIRIFGTVNGKQCVDENVK